MGISPLILRRISAKSKNVERARFDFFQRPRRAHSLPFHWPMPLRLSTWPSVDSTCQLLEPPNTVPRTSCRVTLALPFSRPVYYCSIYIKTSKCRKNRREREKNSGREMKDENQENPKSASKVTENQSNSSCFLFLDCIPSRFSSIVLLLC